VTDDFGSQFFMLGLAQSMDRREEKALNPCHILVQAIPKRQLSSKKRKVLAGFWINSSLGIGGYSLIIN
jgi:hypothetical protein